MRETYHACHTRKPANVVKLIQMHICFMFQEELDELNHGNIYACIIMIHTADKLIKVFFVDNPLV